MRKLTKLIFVTDIQIYIQTDTSDLIGPSLMGVQKVINFGSGLKPKKKFISNWPDIIWAQS